MASKNKSIELFIDGEGLAEMILISVKEEATLEAVLLEAQKNGLTLDETTQGFLGEAVLADRKQKLGDMGIKMHSRLHFHRCVAVLVHVYYNGGEFEQKFLPSATVGDVRTKAVDYALFAIDPAMQANMILRERQGSKEIKLDIQLGTLTGQPTCSVDFDLLLDPRYQGWK